MNREPWADGPPDDRDDEAFERARDAVMNDEDANEQIAAKVRAKYTVVIDEICAGAWSIDGAQTIARSICESANREIDNRARALMAEWAESRALNNVED